MKKVDFSKKTFLFCIEYNFINIRIGVKMKFWEIILIAIGVSMDAFAVSICKGLASKGKKIKTASLCGVWFGLFQVIMPIIGFFLGRIFAGLIEKYDHWIAFALLLIIGINMIKEAFSKDEENDMVDTSFLKMLILALATSIDALAIGVTFAVLNVNIWICVTIIGITTFSFSFVGVIIGQKFGEKHKNKAVLAGGIILVLLGIKILIEHLFF